MYCVSLKRLELFGMFGLTHNSAQAISQNCPHLITLNLGQCWKVSLSLHPYLMFLLNFMRINLCINYAREMVY